jgi:NAD(P)-dependent dehydrogenase (short-subunit alcohol dehydrogenase family)
MQVKGSNAVIVGGASGFARATAELLAERGAKVAILDREGTAGPEVADKLGGTFHALDVLDAEGTEAALNAAAEAMGGFHIAVNTPGGGVAKRTIGKEGPHPLEDFRGVIELNLVATFNLDRLEAWIMSKNEPDEEGERGVIINTSSIAAFEGQIGQVAYTAAKAGIAGMSLVMARDMGSLGIRVNAIAPSLFATGLAQGINPEFEAALTKDAAFPRRMGKADEYAKLALAIVENPMLNGGTIRLDAGTRFSAK